METADVKVDSPEVQADGKGTRPQRHYIEVILDEQFMAELREMANRYGMTRPAYVRFCCRQQLTRDRREAGLEMAK